jgi:hypothetical protein
MKPPKPMTATQLKDLAKAEATLAVNTLRSLMRGKSQASVKLAAAREVLDRAFGKPKAPKPSRARSAKPVKDSGLTVIIKRPEDITPEEEAAAEATERGEL